MDDDDPGFGVFHAGEIAAQEKFGSKHLLKGLAMNVRTELNPALIAFLEAQPFFFMATSNADGDCDCSYRGRQHILPRDPEPLLTAPDMHHLILPDYEGNYFFNSIGNLLTNPKVGLLFVDFRSATRVRINGNARVETDLGTYREIWPTAERYIEVSVGQVYPNCRARIPRLDYD